MKKETNAGISFFQRYLTVWVFLCMVAGIVLGHFAPAIPAALATTVGVLTEVPVMLTLVKIANKTPHWFSEK